MSSAGRWRRHGRRLRAAVSVIERHDVLFVVVFQSSLPRAAVCTLCVSTCYLKLSSLYFYQSSLLVYLVHYRAGCAVFDSFLPVYQYV